MSSLRSLLNRPRSAYLTVAALLLVCSFLSLGWGPLGFLWPHEIASLALAGFPPDDLMASALLHLRLPRLLLAWFSGAALGVAGMFVQAAYRNPLAEPYLLGVSAGAAFGAVLTVILGLAILPLGAFLGAWLAIGCLLALSRYRGTIPPNRFLLAGIALGGIFQAGATFLLLRMDPYNIRELLFWLMGSLAYRDLHTFSWLAPGVLSGLVAAFLLARPLNILTTGDTSAASLGLPVPRFRLLCLLLVAWLTAFATAACGLIAFAGLITPHLCRSWAGPDHRKLLPATLLTGALLLTASDLLARLLFPARELPISLVTGLLGALFFLALLFPKPHST